MTNVAEVANGIYQIETDEINTPGAQGLPGISMIYFIPDGQVLIEIGPAVVVTAVLDAIRQLGHDPSQLAAIILTHIHLDHAGGAGILAQQFPQLKVLVHQRGARHLIDPSRLIEGTLQAFGQSFEDEYGLILPIPERQVRAVEDGEVIPLGDRELRIVYAPGHAPHQMCIYDTKSHGIFSGDALGPPQIGGNIVKAVAGFDLDDALETIDKVSKLEPKIIFHSHGGVNREVAKLLHSVRANTQSYGDIILEAIKTGTAKEEIARRLESYHIEHTTADYQPGDRRFDDIIPWYVAHFKRKGLV
ncbi:MAG: MBL fold metallo-hydrolase [Dehalococcoidales bacterium]|nr:MBL fold metallo-hydrolase [Dehalococcoidales bacterium]